MQIINIDEDQSLQNYNPNTEGHIFAGHVKQIVGVNFAGTKAEAINSGMTPLFYRDKEKILAAYESDQLKSIWLNSDASDNTKFGVILRSKPVIEKFLNDYKNILNYNDFFIVCDDFVLKSHNPQYNYKKFFPVESLEQLNNDFKLWIANDFNFLKH